MYDMYSTRVHQIKSKLKHGGDSSDKCDSHYIKKNDSLSIIIKITDRLQWDNVL